MKETAITAKLVKKLNAIPRCFARKRHGGAFSSGDPDIQVCYKGLTILIEVKVLVGELSELQAVMMQRWQDAGAVCILAVWDAEQKAFAMFLDKTWKEYAGKVKPRVLDIHSGKYFNVREGMYEEMLDGIKEHHG